MHFMVKRESFPRRKDTPKLYEWIFGAFEHGLSIAEIAFEVGLSEPRVKQILKPSQSRSTKNVNNKKEIKTPYAAAMYEFETTGKHSKCNRKDFYEMCNDCFGKMMILQSEYDENGWPYEWAMYGQEKYIEAATQ